MSTCDLLIGGRNQLLYLEKLKKHGITVYSVKKIDEKKIILRLDTQDLEKAIELAGKMWYNKIIGYRGFSYFWETVKRNILIIIATVLFICSIVILNNFIFKIDYSGVPVSHRKTAEKIIKSQSIGLLTPFSNINEGALKAQATANGLSFFEVEKVGFILKVKAKTQDEKHTVVESFDKITAPYSGKIVSIVVFSGTALKKVGDEVYVGETIVEGIAGINQSEYKVKAIAKVVVERIVEKEFKTASSDEQTIRDCIAMARLEIDGVECESSVKITPIGNEFIIKTQLKFLSIINGG